MFNLFNLSLKLNGFPMKEAIAEFEKIKAISDADYENYILSKRKEIVDYHLKNNTSYLEFVGTSEFQNWNELPIMTKKDFQKPLSERLSKGFSKKNIYINKTSGSSGNPFVFAKDKFCHALVWASIMNRFGVFGVNFNQSLQARFYGMPVDFKGKFIIRIKDFLSKRYRLSIFDLSDKKIELIIKTFQKKPFYYINGYTSNIVLIAKYLQKKEIILTHLCPTLKLCVVTSEMLFEEDKLLLEKYLGVPVVNEYGASELDVIAMTSKNDKWQINSETLFVEILNENNEPVPNGTEGKIVITSLYNKAHPFIRYEIGDMGIIDEKSTFKKPILKKLIGRTSDFAILPSGKKAAGMTFYSITKKLFDDTGNVKEFTIKQKRIDLFEIEYVSDTELSESEINSIKKVFEQYLESGLMITFNRKLSLTRNKSGKLKQFVSMIK